MLLILAAFNPASFGRLDLLFSDFSTEVNCMIIYIMCGVAVNVFRDKIKICRFLSCDL